MASPSLLPSGRGLHAHRIRLIYFAYLANVGLMVTYWPYHMQGLGLSAAEIGSLFSLRTLIGIGAQLILPPISDRTGDPARFLKLCLLLIVLFAAGLPFTSSPSLFAALLWLSTPWESALITVLDATTIRHAGDRRYSGIRLWGSIGYGACVALFGLVAADLSFQDAGALAVPVGFVCTTIACIAAFSLPGDDYRSPGDTTQRRIALGLLRTPGLTPFILCNLLHWATVMVFNVFLPLHAQSLQLDTATPGLAVLAAIIGEVAALALAHRVLERAKPANMLVVVMVVSTARWFFTAEATTDTALIAWQSLHGFTFGFWLAAIMSQLSRFAPPKQRASLQGLFAALVYGAGGAVGTGLGGLIVEHASTRTAFLAAAATEASALVLLLLTRKGWATVNPNVAKFSEQSEVEVQKIQGDEARVHEVWQSHIE